MSVSNIFNRTLELFSGIKSEKTTDLTPVIKTYYSEEKTQINERKFENTGNDPLDGVIKGNVWFELFYKNGTTKHIRHSTAENLEYYLQRLNRLYGRTEIPIKIEKLK